VASNLASDISTSACCSVGGAILGGGVDGGRGGVGGG
jgi:hypothetical protein